MKTFKSFFLESWCSLWSIEIIFCEMKKNFWNGTCIPKIFGLDVCLPTTPCYWAGKTPAPFDPLFLFYPSQLAQDDSRMNLVHCRYQFYQFVLVVSEDSHIYVLGYYDRHVSNLSQNNLRWIFLFPSNYNILSQMIVSQMEMLPCLPSEKFQESCSFFKFSASFKIPW